MNDCRVMPNVKFAVTCENLVVQGVGGGECAESECFFVADIGETNAYTKEPIYLSHPPICIRYLLVKRKSFGVEELAKIPYDH